MLLLWDSTEVRNADSLQRKLTFNTATGHDSILAGSLACDDDSSCLLDSSLPLFSESPAIAGKQPPRSRFRRKAKLAAAPANKPAQARQLQQTAPADMDSSNASSCCLHVLLATPAGSAQEQQQHPARDTSLAAAAAPAAGSAGAPKDRGATDMSVLQALLDESCCSAASFLQHACATGMAPQPAAAAAGKLSSSRLKCSLTSSIEYAESMRGSGCSDVTGFKGFWTASVATDAEPTAAEASPCSGARSAATAAAAAAAAMRLRSEAECDSAGEFVLFRAGGGGSMADLGLLNPVAVQDLADRLAAAELRATQQQQQVVKAQQVALQKELQLQLLRQALAASEQEGSSVMDALAAAMDLAAAAGGSGSPRSSLDGTAAAAAVAGAAAASAAVGEPGSSTVEADAELQQLRLQNAALQQHSQALHSTMQEAAQQLDLLEGKVQQLEAEKDAAVVETQDALQRLGCAQQDWESQLQQLREEAAAVLAAEQQHWQAQLQQAGELHASELDEQQAQHEEEVGSLLSRLQEAQQQAAAAQQHCEQLRQELQESEEQCEQLQGEVQDGRAACEAAQAELTALHEALQGSRSDSAADVEQLRRQVASLAAAKAELTAANQALQDAEAGYAAAQMAAGAKSRQLAAQLEVAVDFLEDSVRRLGQHNAQLVQQLQEALAAPAAAVAEARGAQASTAAASAAADAVQVQRANGDGAAGPVSPRTLQSIIAAATRVNEKNKKLKRQLQAMQGVGGEALSSK
ncbi:hypothetical protein OEZ85_003270 [Tetradesmus obliquus]|uniref:Kinesin motor domain-containing protein n=1 Tax=Tetradesmus obliquus TaxID=3088 RepID=A0ABY8U028_TETOB|nr:hypothetical protein OEZ85_003270 [Tetradesmus obliquus]